MKYGMITIGKQIDFEKYTNTDLNGKKLLLLESLLHALVEEKNREKFNINVFENDFRDIL